jgi:hypothetical protein
VRVTPTHTPDPDLAPYRYIDWELEDPGRLPIEQVRPIVEDIDRRVQALVAELVPDVAYNRSRFPGRFLENSPE